MGRRKPSNASEQMDDLASLPRGAVADADSKKIFVPMDPVTTESEVVQSTDSVAEVLGGKYSESIVDEVRSYAKAGWDEDASSLDPIDDIVTFYDYDFKLPPDAYDALQETAQLKLEQLEKLKEAPDAATVAKIATRFDLVNNKTGDELRRLKHKAYYRGIRRIRAGKAAEAAAEAAEAAAEEAAAAAGEVVDQHPEGQQQTQDMQQQQQQRYAQKYAHLSEDEVLAAVSDPSEWDMGWTSTDYSQHPQVLQQLRSTYSAGFGLPAYMTAAEQEAEDKRVWREYHAAQEAAQRQLEEEEAARQEVLRKHLPFQAYTPEYLQQQRRQKALTAHRRAKQQVFWMSVCLALGSSAYRWWQQRGGKGKRRRTGAAAQQQRQSVTSSRRSSRPPTPSGMQMQSSIAE